jgi:hypothetical protein
MELCHSGPGHVLKGSNKTSSLVALFLVEDLIEGRVDAAATNNIHWGGGWH